MLHQPNKPTTLTHAAVQEAVRSTDGLAAEQLEAETRQTVSVGLRRRRAPAPTDADLLQVFDVVPRPLPPIAKFDHSSVIVLGLFTSLHRKAGSRSERVEFTKEFEDGDVLLTVSCGSALGDTDQRVLRGLVAQATDDHAAIVAAERFGRAAPADLNRQVRATCTLQRLAQVAGFGSPGAGPTNKVLRKCLARLEDVTLRWTDAMGAPIGNEERLITNEGTSKGSGAVDVVFHTRLEAAILASRPGEQYLKVGMDEARQLQGSCARLLHHRLSHMNEGASTVHSIGTLASYVWPNGSDSRHSERSRRSQLVNAIMELRTVGWRFDRTERSGCFKVVRPVANSFRAVDGSHSN